MAAVPTWLIVVICAFLALALVFAIGGAVYVRRRNSRAEGSFDAVVAEANRSLAAAHAQDNGWEPEALRAAARRLYAAERPDAEVKDVTLVAVRDEPGTDRDQAVFRVATAGEAGTIWLGRRGDEWVADEVT